MIVYHFVYSVISYVGRCIRRPFLGPKTMRIFFLKCCLKCTRGGCRAAAAPQAFPLRCCEQQERARRSSGRRARARGAGDARAVRCPVGGYCDAFSASAPGVYWARVGYGARLTSRGREGGRSQVGVAGSDARSLPRFLLPARKRMILPQLLRAKGCITTDPNQSPIGNHHRVQNVRFHMRRASEFGAEQSLVQCRSDEVLREV